jgi:hypothetical protein
MHAPNAPTPPAGSTVAPRPGERDGIETAVAWASGTAAVAMFAYGVALSYSVLYQIAVAAGLSRWGARAWPLGWELFMASAALNVLAEQRHLRGQPPGWQRVPWYPWTLTGLTAGGSVLLNWFHPAIPLDPPPGWLVSLVYGLPPLEAVLAWHLFLQRVAHRRHPARTPRPVSAAGLERSEAAPPAVPDRPGGSHRPRQVAGPAAEDGSAEDRPPAGRDDPGPSRPADRDRPPTGQPGRTGSVAARPRPLASPRRPAGTDGGREAALLAQARAADADYRNRHGRPISRDALRQTLRVSNQSAGALLRRLHTNQADPDHQPTPDGADLGPVPAAASDGAGIARVVAGDGAGDPGRAGTAALASAVPAVTPGQVGRGVAGDA